LSLAHFAHCSTGCGLNDRRENGLIGIHPRIL
jgi:hypothetical protein